MIGTSVMKELRRVISAEIYLCDIRFLLDISSRGFIPTDAMFGIFHVGSFWRMLFLAYFTWVHSGGCYFWHVSRGFILADVIFGIFHVGSFWQMLFLAYFTWVHSGGCYFCIFHVGWFWRMLFLAYFTWVDSGGCYFWHILCS